MAGAAIKGVSIGAKAGGTGAKAAGAAKNVTVVKQARPLTEQETTMQKLQMGVELAQSIKGLGGGGRGGGDRIGRGKSAKRIAGMIILIFILALVAIVGFWFVSKGGLQQTASSKYVAEKQQEIITENIWMRRVQNWFENPFGIRATTGQYEEVSEATQAGTTAPNQAFSISVKATPNIVQYNTEAITVVITVKNEGSAIIKQMQLDISSEQPQKNCLQFSDISTVSGKKCFQSNNLADNPEYTCNLEDIPPFASKQIILTGGKISKKCVAEAMNTLDYSFDPSQPTNIFINVKGSTYFPASSRIAVERIQRDYGVLLIQNSLLVQQSRGAIYQTGTALTLDLDVGEQPILYSVEKGSLLMSWANVGSGKLDSRRSPFLFIITPGSFGKCKIKGFKGVEVSEDTTDTLSTVYQDTYDTCMRRNDPLVVAKCSSSEECSKSELGVDEKSACIKSCVEKEMNSICASEASAKQKEIKNIGSSVTSICNDAQIMSGDYVIKCMICDDALKQTWCNEGSPVKREIELSAGSIKESFAWACSLIGQKDEKTGMDKYHVCATNGLTEEFGIMSCSLDLTEKFSANRLTRYITALALYPYVIEAQYATVQAYDIE